MKGNLTIKKEHAHWWVLLAALLLGAVLFFAHHLHAY
jgi:hypothetical protein